MSIKESIKRKIFRRRCKKIDGFLSFDFELLVKEYPEYYKQWIEIRKINKTAWSSQNFRFFIYLRECDKLTL